MKKQSVILGLATFAIFSLVACTKDQAVLTPKDTEEAAFLAQEASEEDAFLTSVPGLIKAKSWKIQLNGANEVPANSSPMIGLASMNLYKNGAKHFYTYTILLRKEPVGRVISAAHIHREKVGSNGPVIFQLLKKTAPTVGTLVDFGIKGQKVMITEAQYLDLLNGVNPYYFNVHSNVFPGGEIRGQLEPGQ